MKTSNIKKLADKSILLENTLSINITKTAAMYWILKDFQKNRYDNAELKKEINNLKFYLSTNLQKFNLLNISKNIVTLGNNLQTAQSRNYLMLLSYTAGITAAIDKVDINFLLERNKLLETQNKEWEIKYKQLFKRLKKFLTPGELKEEALKIYMRVLKNSNKPPTVENLEIASNKTISKSSWDRKLKSIPFLYLLTSQLEKLLKITSEKPRYDYYFDIYQKLYILYDSKVSNELEYKKTKGKLSISDDEEKNIVDFLPDNSRTYISGDSSYEEVMNEFSNPKYMKKK